VVHILDKIHDGAKCAQRSTHLNTLSTEVVSPHVEHVYLSDKLRLTVATKASSVHGAMSSVARSHNLSNVDLGKYLDG